MTAAFIEVESPGLLTTVQDLGREGYAFLGVSASGAADAVSLRVGNLLVGNHQNAPALEMTMTGGTFRFPQGGVVALTGSDFGATLDGVPVAPWAAMQARRDQTLTLGPTRSGARCYLCVHGGIAVQPFLGSASTHLLSGLGGFDGRPLREGDRLPIASNDAHANPPLHPQSISPEFLSRLAPRRTLRVTAGPQSDWFPESSRRSFYESAYRLTEDSNRMGIRLLGASVPCSSAGEMITEGVSLGAIQVPPGGQPIILFVEQQTTGGYPKIANVISADMHIVGQLRPRDEIHFEFVALEAARALLLEQEQALISERIIVK